MKTIFAVLLLLVASTLAAELPGNWKKCAKSDPKYFECMADAVRDAIVSLGGGMKSFKILPIEPLSVDTIKIGESGGSVALNQEYRNIKIYGLTKGLAISNYRIDWDKLVFSSQTFNPQVDFVGDYTINGKVLILPIKGSGKCNITMYNLEAANKIQFEKFEKKGETYFKAKSYSIKFTPGRVSLDFENLFNGDKVLGPQMNKFLNENSELIFQELQAPFEETFGLVFTKLANDVFSRVPISKIFES